ncbi:uncharacterized protein I303_100939 [Kwoniella dejecticola CBS 10117]|uniref:Protein kinase regulator n=1 Tax=Kwoniella dejecticola CBS 10117 TaxID=1296121 RepID=A0A1A6AGE7_9TREE|nr:uncharacterized protein I303_00943 [Kwoniella dejecticola CBS 10117]OBR89121.1 hypothetical protein I303_00943 [Kwoniella dejecticola CBS 10117]
MSVTSPISASPGLSLLEWDEAAVHSYLSDLGFGKYEDVIFEHGITGDVLAVMDHGALQDLGMTSLGHRLNLLRAVWELKKEQGIEFGEDDWKPQDVEDSEKVTQSNVDRLLDLIMEQHERLIHLEKEQVRMLSAFEEHHIQIPHSADAEVRGIPGMDGKSTLGRAASLRWKDFKERGSDGEDGEAGPSRTNRRASTIFPSSLASSTASTAVPHSQSVPHQSDTPTFQDSFTPSTVTSSYPFDSPLAPAKNDGDKRPNPIQPPPLSRMLSSGPVSSSSTNTVTSPPASQQQQQQGLSVSKNTSVSASSAATSANAPSEKAKSQANAEARSAAKSFRVTLEDPCWKVLPAALKKYKINDDWKLYALFICFDNTERCLSYDEKPLLLFQKLKESGHKPVFMLRHIKDIRSPIAVAQQKQAQKLGLPPNTSVNVLPKIKPSSDTSISPTKATSLQPGGRDENGNTPNGGNFPELPSPGLKDSTNDNSASSRHPTTNGQTSLQPGQNTGTMVDKDGNIVNVTYAVAIYPYIADRQDEFNVAVGSTYTILSKAKGWYIVQKDPDGLGRSTDPTQGWVPAGCLLELSQPISLASPTSSGEIATYPGLSPLPPTNIISSSYAGNVLMDYEAKGDAELSLKEGDKVRVYKKYCHCINSETGERGWVPAWFVGKATNESSNTSANGGTPLSASTPTFNTLAQPVNSGSTTDTKNGNGDTEERLRDDNATPTPTPGQGGSAVHQSQHPGEGNKI